MKLIFTLLFGLIISTAAQATTYTIAATNYVFTPATQSVQVGDIVQWTFSGTHDVTSGSSCTADQKFASGTKNTGDTYSFTFTTKGTFPYFCSFHCSAGMVGTITVTSNSGIENLEASAAALKCYPNPFSVGTTISYELKNNAQVSISVVDMTGKKIIDIHNNKEAGNYIEPLNLTSNPTGLYILQMSLNGVPGKELVLVKE